MGGQRHATDGDLVRLLDGETTAADTELASHVSACAECSARLARLRLRSQRVAAELRATDLPPVDPAHIRPPLDEVSAPRARRRRQSAASWRRSGVRAAAGLLLLAGVAAASPAARTWIAERLLRLRGSPAPRPEAGHRRPALQPRTGATVWFAAPPGEELVVRFSERPAGGMLELSAGDDDERAAAQVVARAADATTLIVLPDELRVSNSRQSTADYRVTVPRRVRRVRIYFGPGEARPLLVDVPRSGRHLIPLAARATAPPAPAGPPEARDRERTPPPTGSARSSAS